MRPGSSSASLKQRRQASFAASRSGLRGRWPARKREASSLKPAGLVEGFARDEAERNLRGRAIERGAQKQAALIGDRQKRFFRFWKGDSDDVGCVDPKMAGTETIAALAAHKRRLGARRWPGFGHSVAPLGGVARLRLLADRCGMQSAHLGP